MDEDTRRGFDELKIIIEKLREHMDSKFEGLDQKFPSKDSHNALVQRVSRVENALLWVVGLVMAAVIAATLGLVLYHPSNNSDTTVNVPNSLRGLHVQST